jgi:hypothetical protein
MLNKVSLCCEVIAFTDVEEEYYELFYLRLLLFLIKKDKIVGVCFLYLSVKLLTKLK